MLPPIRWMQFDNNSDAQAKTAKLGVRRKDPAPVLDTMRIDNHY